MYSYRFKYYSAISDKWLLCIIRADSFQAAVTKLKGTRTIIDNRYHLVGACGSSQEATSVYDTTTGYIEALLWADGQEEGDQFYGADTLNQPKLEQILHKHIKRFIRDNRHMLDQYINDLGYGCLGHDMYLTEQGHGAGFWDRGLGGIGDKLTEYCAKYNLAKYIEECSGVLQVHPAYNPPHADYTPVI